jgi:hypothetical protein
VDRWDDSLAVAFVIAVLLALLFWPLIAHGHGAADWIRQEGWRNRTGEFCCGEHDCFPVEGAALVSHPAPGWLLPGGELVPQHDAMPSRDGRFWRCRRPDGSRRCFFAPPPAM